jgi:hypothetical protein
MFELLKHLGGMRKLHCQISLDTRSSVYGLSDIYKKTIHLTVPRSLTGPPVTGGQTCKYRDLILQVGG